MTRPKTVTNFIPGHTGYLDHNRYFNEAEKVFDKLEIHLGKIPVQFIKEAYCVLDRGTENHRVWAFEEWFETLKILVEAEQ